MTERLLSGTRVRFAVDLGLRAGGFYEGVDGFIDNPDFSIHGKTAQVEPLKKTAGTATAFSNVSLSFKTEDGSAVTVIKNIDHMTSQALQNGQGVKIIYLRNSPSTTRWPWEKREVTFALLFGLFDFVILIYSYMSQSSK